MSGHTDAWQWLGGVLQESAPDWVAEASEPTASGLAAPTLTGGLTVWTARGKQRAKVRDWIARIDGEIYLFTESAWAVLSVANSHADLVRALEAALPHLDNSDSPGGCDGSQIGCDHCLAIRLVRAALATLTARKVG